MSIELGHFALILGFAIAILQAVAGLLLWRRSEVVVGFVRQASVMQFVLIALAFAALIQAFVTSDFSLKLAYESSHSLQPLIYKVTSVWGNHEGSILLWVLILVAFGAAVAVAGTRLPTELHVLVLSVQGLLVAAFSGFAIFTSNPFLRLDPAPFEGRDLNPILQDIGLAIHPPLLYIGYVGFSVCFAFATGALISGKIDAAWARWVRPWALASWTFLTLGIAMGSYWAYYELGWGGWWVWDPVENASFMPWLAGTALLHSALVMEKRNALKIWTIFLSILAFSLSLLGTFLVRSGILTSVHSFASDPARGLVILALLAAFIGGAFALFALRASSLRAGGLFAPISREGALILNNLFLMAGLAAVFTGTLYPLILDALTGNRISVGAPFFEQTFGALMVPLLVVLPFGPFLAWKRADLRAVSQRLLVAAVFALVAAIAVFVFAGGELSLAPFGFLAGFWLVFGAIAELADRARLGRIPAGESWSRIKGFPRSAWSTAISHLGLGITVLGIVAASSWSTENITTLAPGETAALSGYAITLNGQAEVPGPNYQARRYEFAVVSPSGSQTMTTSERRIYGASGMPTTESAILTYGLSQLYISIGDPAGDNGVVVRLWYKPFITMIWYGCLIMAIAGFLSLSDRRLRVGVPKSARRQLEATQ